MTASVLGSWLGVENYQGVGFAETSDVAAAVNLGNKSKGCCYGSLGIEETASTVCQRTKRFFKLLILEFVPRT